MTTEGEHAATRLTLAGGGWVLLAALALAGLVLAWGLGSAVVGHRPLGDGDDPATYGFDLTMPADVPGPIVASGQPRDFLPPLDDPRIVAGGDVLELNARERGKLLVTSDRVIGVSVEGEHRAYPLSLMNVHEVCNDVLGGVPIAVTYSPLCDSVVVFNRRLEGRVARFALSGLLLDSNHLLYDRTEDAGGAGPRSLWSQLRRRAVSGPAAAAGAGLRPLPGVQLVTWGEWLSRHPDTTVVVRDARQARRVKETDYRRYWLGGEPIFPVEPLPTAEELARDGATLMTPVVVVERGGDRLALPFSVIDRDGVLEAEVGGDLVRFERSAEHDTVHVAAPPDAIITHARLFAWHAAAADLTGAADGASGSADRPAEATHPSGGVR